jgi:LysR family hydrogen peroxide-inducible transcriptional activator
MEIHQLRYFCAVARHGTFTRASQAEHVAQPSLSQQILKLEAELGVQLLERLARPARLTVFGKAFLPKAERILRELDEARTEVRELADAETGDVLVGVISAVAPYLLPKLLGDFSRRHPHVNVRATEDVTPVLIDRLRQGSLDVTLVALPVAGEDLACTRLLEEAFFAALPARHPRAGQETVRLADLDGEPFLLLKEGHCFRDSLIEACHQARARPNVVFESGQFATILAMVAAGMGVSAVPAMAVQATPGCRFVRIAGGGNRRTIGAVRLRNRFKTRAQLAFLEHASSAAGQVLPPAPV